jgi:hypothetical protein
MDCLHPQPNTVVWLVCQECGTWRDGQRIGPFTVEALQKALSGQTGKPTELYFGDNCYAVGKYSKE